MAKTRTNRTRAITSVCGLATTPLTKLRVYNEEETNIFKTDSNKVTIIVIN